MKNGKPYYIIDRPVYPESTKKEIQAWLGELSKLVQTEQVKYEIAYAEELLKTVDR